MDNIRVLVVDDEKPAQARILDLLEKQADIEVVGVGRSGNEAIQLVRTHAPDLLFLDVQMPGMDGFDVLREIAPETPSPSIIFITGYDKYAIHAFEANALDYLLKPYSDERFEAALQRGRNYIRTRTVGQLGLQFARLLESQAVPREEFPHLERVLIRSAGRVTFLDVRDIDWIEAAGVYVELHAGPKQFLYRATVGQIQERLDPKRFVRVHRSTIINTTRIVELHPRTHGDYIVVLKGGTELTLSRGYRHAFESWLQQPL
jgi:two-component system, LytTR family, response regulator